MWNNKHRRGGHRTKPYSGRSNEQKAFGGRKRGFDSQNNAFSNSRTIRIVEHNGYRNDNVHEYNERGRRPHSKGDKYSGKPRESRFDFENLENGFRDRERSPNGYFSKFGRSYVEDGPMGYDNRNKRKPNYSTDINSKRVAFSQTYSDEEDAEFQPPSSSSAKSFRNGTPFFGQQQDGRSPDLRSTPTTAYSEQGGVINRQHGSNEAYFDHVARYSTLSETPKIVAELLNFILGIEGGVAEYVKLLDFGLSNRTFSGEEGFRSFLENNGNLFGFFTKDKTEQVKATTEVKFCPAFSKEPKSCEGNCGALHLCKFYVLSSCEMMNCKFGHTLDDDHNQEVLQKNFLHRLGFTNLRLLLRHVENRCAITVPVICRFYNSKGCDKSPCPFLHVCQLYVTESCENNECQRLHGLYGKNVPQILKKYGLDLTEVPQSDILKLLRTSLNKFNETERLSKSWNRSRATIANLARSFDCHRAVGTDFIKSKTKVMEEKGGYRIFPAWTITGTDRTLNADEMQEIENLFQRFEQAKKQTITVSGEQLLVNFEDFSCSFSQTMGNCKLKREMPPRFTSLESISSSSTQETDNENTEEGEILSEDETEI